MNTRICSTCKVEKEIIEFHRKKQGHSYMCKECRKSYIKQHYSENKDKYILSAKKSRESNLEWFKELKSELKCIECGENHIATLDFHHKDPSQKDSNISELILKGSRKKVIEEIDKCDVLCSNCHRKLHYNLRNN